MYAFVNVKGGVGRAFEEHCATLGKEPREMIEAMVENFVASKNMTHPPAEDQGTGLAKFVHVYLKMRDTKQALGRLVKAEEAAIEEQMDRIESHLLAKLDGEGVKNMSTDRGLFYKEKTIKPSCGDWDAFYKWIVENDAFEFLERRVTKTAVQKYMEDHGELPPGIAVLQEFKVVVRKS